MNNNDYEVLLDEYEKLNIERPDMYPLNLKESLPEREIVIVTSDSMPLSPAAREFIKFFQEN